MKLPHTQSVRIEQAKIVEYLLNPVHPDNGTKATFFEGWGFAVSDWTVLANAIRQMVAHQDVVDVIQSAWGQKYIVDGTLVAPAGTTPVVRTVWIVDALAVVPRLVTAYPRK
jgi:hypothetical protein